MAGIFGNKSQYTKPGPGVSKTEKNKNRFFCFWDLLYRKLWNLCRLNLMFLLFVLPLFVTSGVIFYFLRQSVSFSITQNLLLTMIFTMAPFMLSGPAVGGLVKIARDYAREESVFLWSDFLEAIKINWKQTLLLSVLSFISLSMISTALPFYYNTALGVVGYLLFAVSVLVSVLLVFMHYYVYIMAVSFRLTFKQLIKNAAILSMVCFFRNVLIAFILTAEAVLTAGLFWMALTAGSMNNVLTVLLLLFLLLLAFSFPAFACCYIVFPVLKKYIIDPYYEKNPQQTSKAIEKSPVGSQNESENAEGELPEYVYHNGRMVHRAVLEKDVLFDDTLLDQKTKTSFENSSKKTESD